MRRFCVRMLGEGEAARGAEQSVAAADGGDRGAALRAAVAATRERADVAGAAAADLPAPTDLAGAVAAEVSAAAAGLPLRQRELLALRELLRLPYDEIAAVAGVAEDELPVALARSRLGLRARLRGTGNELPECAERERALRTIALRQDAQPVPPADDEWLIDHLGHCRGCAQAHASVLEASACYRAWRSPDALQTTDALGSAPSAEAPGS